MRTLSEGAKYIPLIVPKSITSTETGTGVNIEAYGDDAMGVVSYGALGGTSETFVTTFEGSNDDSSYTVIATVASVTGSSGDNKSAAGRVNLSGYKYVRAKITMSGTSASLVSAGILVRPPLEGSSVNSLTPA